MDKLKAKKNWRWDRTDRNLSLVAQKIETLIAFESNINKEEKGKSLIWDFTFRNRHGRITYHLIAYRNSK